MCNFVTSLLCSYAYVARVVRGMCETCANSEVRSSVPGQNLCHLDCPLTGMLCACWVVLTTPSCLPSWVSPPGCLSCKITQRRNDARRERYLCIQFYANLHGDFGGTVFPARYTLCGSRSLTFISITSATSAWPPARHAFATDPYQCAKT